MRNTLGRWRRLVPTFRRGHPDAGVDFDPQQGNWMKVKEPAAWLLLTMSVLLGMVLALALAAGWYCFAVRNAVSLGSWSGQSTLATVLLAVLVSVPLHEFLHACSYPGGPFGERVQYGATRFFFAFWVTFDGEMPLPQRICSKFVPLLPLTVVPLLLPFLLGSAPQWLLAVAFINFAGSAADLITALTLMAQAPWEARVRDKGTATWWVA